MADGREVTRAPAVKAGSALDTLAFVDEYRAGARAEVLSRMPGSTRERFLARSRTDWIPFEEDRVFIDALLEVFDHEGMVDLVRRSVTRHFKSALLSTVVHGAIRLFGLTPSGLLRMLPRAWPMVYRDVASPSYRAVSSNHGEVHFDEFAPHVLSHPGYRASIEGMLLGVLDVAKVAGTVELAQVSGSSLVASVRWDAVR